jgi:acyl-CoA synthetase (AMP-forming)/AMP-acid ligase II
MINDLTCRKSKHPFGQSNTTIKVQDLLTLTIMFPAAKTIAGLVDAVALRAPSRIALTSPFQSQRFTYDELRQTTTALAGWLDLYGYSKGDILVSDLPNVSENLFLQLACNRLGVAYATCKNLEGMQKFPKVQGAVSVAESGFLAETNFPAPCLSADFLIDLIHNGGLKDFTHEDFSREDDNLPHAYYNSTTPYTNQQALEQGEEAAWELSMYEDDVVCVSVTLCHAFGIGSAVSSAWTRGAVVALPAVGGIQGCGVPSERAAATLEVLEKEKCTLLFADTHTLKALPDPPHDLALRGGVCKIGSGSTFLEETREYGGVKLRTMGKK